MAKRRGLYEDGGNVHQIVPEDDLQPHCQDYLFPIEPTQWFKDNCEKE